MSASVTRRAVFAAKFLKPPGFYKRALMREKPRLMTGPFENPVRKMVRLREKAAQYSFLPPPRRVPTVKPSPRKTFLQPVTGVPTISPDALQARLDFLLGEKAIQQQLSAPLLPGNHPYSAELHMWERQMRDLRKVYRAQYLQKLATVTAEEGERERQLYVAEMTERRERRKLKLQNRSIAEKRMAILKDRRRIESRVNETFEMTRRSRLKKRQIGFLKKLESPTSAPTPPIYSEETLNEVFPDAADPLKESKIKTTSSSAEKFASILNRNVSVPKLVKTLGSATDSPKQKNRKIVGVQNIHREILEQSYDILPEDEDPFGSNHSDDKLQQIIPVDEVGLSPQQRAELYYVGFSPEDKIELIEQKIQMLQQRQKAEEAKGSSDVLTSQLIDLLSAAKAAHMEKEQVRYMKSSAERDDHKKRDKDSD